MTIGILNAYNAENLGDQAIVQCTLAWCRRAFPDARVLVFSHHFEANRKFFGEDSKRPIGWLPPASPRVERLIQPLVEIAQYHLGQNTPDRETFEDCDLYILCGGGYLYSSKAPLVSRNLLLACWQGIAVAKDKPVVLFPQSIGPLSKPIDRWAVKMLCRKARLLMPRCAGSLATLRHWGFEDKAMLVPDVVLAMRALCPTLYPSTARTQSGLGIAPINLSFVPELKPGTTEEYLEKLEIAAVRFHKATGESVRLYLQVGIHGSDDDREALNPLHSRLAAQGIPVEVVDTNGDLGPYIESLSTNRVFIGCRMHACIFSLTTYTPTIGLAYQPKFFGTFRALALGDWVRPIDSWSQQWLEERIDESIRQAGPVGWKIRENVHSAASTILAQLDKTIPLGRPFLSSSLERSYPNPRFTIVTPSHNQVDWLKFCSASVMDQRPDDTHFVEHIIQDTGSPEIRDFASAAGADLLTDDHSREIFRDRQDIRKVVRSITIYCESDNGMYDAINRGFRRSHGEFLAWLNCDEQYLPGTLAKVAGFFDQHPEVDIVFGDAMLVDENGDILSYRRTILPSVLHTQLSHLNILSCATFVRRRVIERGFFLKPEWKAIADAIWITDLRKAGFKMAVISEPLAVFTLMKNNLGQSSLAYHEMLRWRRGIPIHGAWLQALVVGVHRLRKFFAGAYGRRPASAGIFTSKSPRKRILVQRDNVPFGWPKKLEEILPSDKDFAEARLRIPGLLGKGLLIPLVFSFLVQALDQKIPGVSITPLLSLTFLCALALFARPAEVLLAALVLSIGALKAFLGFRNLLPYEARDYMFVVVRFGSFLTASIIAVLLSHSKQKAADALKATETILAQIPAPVVVSDSSGMIIRVNHEANFLFGLDPSPVGQKWPLLMLCDRDEGSATRAYIQYFGARGGTGKDVRLFLKPDPEQPKKARIICLGRGSQRVMITVIEHFSSLS